MIDLKLCPSYRWLETNVDAEGMDEEKEGRWARVGHSSPFTGVPYSHGGLRPGASGPKAEAQLPEGGSLLSPRIQKALEGVCYIADHLRAEDADSSVSGGWGRGRPLGDSTGLVAIPPGC